MITKKELMKRCKQQDMTLVTPPKEAIDILSNPNLFKDITEKELDKRVTGEYKSRKAITLGLCSMWVENLETPMNIMVSSESSAGKSYICKQIIKIFPKNLVEYRTKISGEAFTYWHVNEEDWSWDGKICYLEDISQGVLDSATFKVMCSDGSVATVVRNQRAVDLIIDGTPCMLITTATTNPTQETLNRFFIVPLDESAKQTHDITFQQAMDIEKEEYDKNLIVALTYLNRVKVSVPYSVAIQKYLTDNYSWEDVRMRRDFGRLIGLIKCSTALHQFQREKDKQGRFIATEKDYEIARECINYIQTTTLKGLTHNLKKAYECCVKEQEFTAKEIHAKHSIICNQAMWYRHLSELCKRKLLVTELRKTENSDKKVNFFMIPKQVSFNLPNFDELCRNSIRGRKGRNSIISINATDNSISNSTKYTNSIKKAGKYDNSKPIAEVIKVG